MRPRVTHVEWLSRQAEEALLTVQSGDVSVKAFCQPCFVHEGDELNLPLMAFDTSSIHTSEPRVFADLVEAPFAYDCAGVVKDAAQRLVLIGDLPVRLDVPLPMDIRAGDYVQFRCSRIDCIE